MRDLLSLGAPGLDVPVYHHRLLGLWLWGEGFRPGDIVKIDGDGSGRLAALHPPKSNELTDAWTWKVYVTPEDFDGADRIYGVHSDQLTLVEASDRHQGPRYIATDATLRGA